MVYVKSRWYTSVSDADHVVIRFHSCIDYDLDQKTFENGKLKCPFEPYQIVSTEISSPLCPTMYL